MTLQDQRIAKIKEIKATDEELRLAIESVKGIVSDAYYARLKQQREHPPNLNEDLYLLLRAVRNGDVKWRTPG
jgi:hypothetical protein